MQKLNGVEMDMELERDRILNAMRLLEMIDENATLEDAQLFSGCAHDLIQSVWLSGFKGMPYELSNTTSELLGKIETRLVIEEAQLRK